MFTWRYILDGEDTASLSQPIWRGPGGKPLEIDGPNDPSTHRPERRDLARYAPMLPVEPDHFQTLGAGMTPLIEGELAGLPVRFKLDSLLPTGSFKDRGAAVVVSHLRALGTRRIVVDSSGNAAASMAAYSAAAGIECRVFAPASASPGKLVQSRAYGSDVTLVEGTREDVARAAQQAATDAEHVSYVSHNWSPVFAEGVKTWALEVWEQLGNQVPDRVFVPTGGGSALMGGFRGFEATGTLPAIVACQPAACAPVVRAIENNDETVAEVEPQATIAEGARISNPPRNQLLLKAVRQSGGRASAVSEEELRVALVVLWRQGIYAEPTAALGAAAFIQAACSGAQFDGTTVILITGSGLKATDTIQDILGNS